MLVSGSLRPSQTFQRQIKVGVSSSGAERRYVTDQLGLADLAMFQKHYRKWQSGFIGKPSIDPIDVALPRRSTVHLTRI